MKNTVKNIILGLIFSFLPISTFAINWDNDNFLDNSFWAQNPTSGDIINALYGNGSGGDDKTAYTRNWTTINCNISNITINYINSGTNTIPSTLNANTIYILNSGAYISNTTINLNGCSAIIGKENVQMYSSLSLTNGIYNNTKNNTILDNLEIDGYNNGNGGTHTKNYMGVRLYNAQNNTINNVNIYNNSSRGLGLYNSNYNLINNFKTFNNDYGIDVSSSINVIFNNILSFNNSYGLYTESTTTNTIFNNSQFFNNSYGIHVRSSDNIFSNINIYNNSSYGIYIESDRNIFSNTSIYNNTSYGIYIASTSISGNVFYNTLKLHNNTQNSYRTALNDKYFKPGSVNISGRITGTVDSTATTMSSEFIVNPQNSYGKFLLDMTSIQKGINTSRSGTKITTYRFGASINKQKQPKIFSGGIIDGNISRKSTFPIGLLVFDINTYFQGNGYKKGTGSIVSVSDTTLVGNLPIRGDFLNLFTQGKLSIPIVLQSTGTNLIEASIPANTTIKNYLNEIYTGFVQAPKTISIGGISGVPNVCNAISVGTYGGESIYFKDDNGNPMTVNMTMPVNSCSSFATGSNIGVYVRQGTGPRTYMRNSTITTISGTKYITFNTTHFTDFAVGGLGTGTFVINNDAATTNSLNVTLNMTMPTNISGMQFSNDGITRSNRESFTETKSRSLTGTSGIKTVYAAFDFDGNNSADIQISDIITYDPFGASAGSDGTLTLEILGGPSECMYGTSLNLGTKTSEINSSYTFTGTFTGDWYCMDYKGISSGRAFTIQTSNLSGTNGGVISGSNVWISHNTPFAEGAGCTGYIGTSTQFYSTALPIMEKISGYNNICKVTLSNVGLEINVPANTAPGDYQGVLTMTLPNGF